MWLILIIITAISDLKSSLTILLHNYSLQVIAHSPGTPFLFVGSGVSSFKGHLGNFVIKDYVEERIALKNVTVIDDAEGMMRVQFHRDGTMKVLLWNFLFDDLPAKVIHRPKRRATATANLSRTKTSLLTLGVSQHKHKITSL